MDKGFQKMKKITAFLIKLHFDEEGTLIHAIYRERDMFDFDVREAELKKPEHFIVDLWIRLTANENDNHNPFRFNPNDPMIDFNLNRGRVLSVMLDKLNYHYSKMAVIDFENFEYGEREYELIEPLWERDFQLE